METLPTLENAIRRRAEKKLNDDINRVDSEFRSFLGKQSELLNNIPLKILDDDDKKITPFLSQILNTEYVRNKIIDNHLSEYITKEIKSILNK